MDKQARKLAVRDDKDRTPPAGIYRLTCAVTGQVWVGQARDLDKIGNRLKFSLQGGTVGKRSLAAAAREHGAAAIAFDVLETLAEDLPAVALPRRLKDRQAHWCDTLGTGAA